MEKIQVSTSAMKWGLYFSIGISIIILPLFISMVPSLFSRESAITLVFVIFLVWLNWYIIKYGAVAYLDDNKIYLEQNFGKNHEYDQDKIKKLTFFKSGKSEYMHVFIENENGGTDKYLLGGFSKIAPGAIRTYDAIAEIVEVNGGSLPDDIDARG